MDSWPWKIALVLAIIGVREFVRLLSPKDTKGETVENSRWAIETLDSAAIAIGLVLFVIQPFLLQAFTFRPARWKTRFKSATVCWFPN